MINPFEQNVIAVIWDFDKTLISDYMQKPIFEHYEVDGNEFWKEVNSLETEYRKRNPDIRINKDTIYLNHFLTCVQQGIFAGLNNQKLREFGSQLNFYPGMPEFLETSRQIIQSNERYKQYSIKVEHYIVSTGLAEMIRGSKVAPYVDGIWGCEFIEDVIQSQLDVKLFPKKDQKKDNENSVISQIGYAVDNTSKTRAIFEINKGANKNPNIDVNSTMDRSKRRVPFEQMIYIADGPSDVPAFSIIKQNGGSTFAVYPKGRMREFQQVDQLRRDGRIDMYGEADYTAGSVTYMWIIHRLEEIADKIAVRKDMAIRQSVSNPPTHIN